MKDSYEPTRKALFAYFCRHHNNLIEYKFQIPFKLRIKKKRQSKENLTINKEELNGSASTKNNKQVMNRTPLKIRLSVSDRDVVLSTETNSINSTLGF